MILYTLTGPRKQDGSNKNKISESKTRTNKTCYYQKKKCDWMKWFTSKWNDDLGVFFDLGGTTARARALRKDQIRAQGPPKTRALDPPKTKNTIEIMVPFTNKATEWFEIGPFTGKSCRGIWGLDLIVNYTRILSSCSLGPVNIYWIKIRWVVWGYLGYFGFGLNLEFYKNP